MGSTHDGGAILVLGAAPSTERRGIVRIRPAGAQRAPVTAGPTAVVRRGTGTGRRLPVMDVDRLADAVATAITPAPTELWLCEREWFVARLGPGIRELERVLIDRASAVGIPLRGWTAADHPRWVEVYDAVEDPSSSHGAALDHPGE